MTGMQSGAIHYSGRCRQAKAGFTLLEVMLAMSILAIALVAVFQSQSQSISMMARSRFDTTAPLLAQGKMAELEAITSADVTSDSGDFGDDYPGYSWSFEIMGTEIPGVEKVEVAVKNENMKSGNTFTLELYRVALR
ncbi:MAG: prepilin-type N-terminal cleavage/methylation domain-containing protein [Deltaproteobacteria bacterium]|nr:prepilin-type N-terminal cleavage/methylation domain-containing protein [Deltaproteobacteria bacterium]